MPFASMSRPLRLSSAIAWLVFAPACGGDGDGGDAPVDAGSDAPVTVFDGGGAPAIPPDGESLCAAGECNYQTGGGCDSDSACLPRASGTTVAPECQPAGVATVGAPCAGWNDCVAGAFCAEGTCRKLCCGGDWAACPTGESCIRQLLVASGGETVAAGADLCFPVGTCELFAADACADEPDRSCQIVDPIGNVACAPRGEAAVGTACDGQNPCVDGASCIGGVCRRLCRAVEGGEPTCPAGEGVCVHFTRDPEGVGECTPR